MRAFLIVLISAALASGCKKQTGAAEVQHADTVKKVISADTNVVNYLALGDSYTIGQSVDPNASYPVQLGNVLNVTGYSAPYPTIIATTGWTTDNLIHAITQNAGITNKKYQVVTLLIGVNDQYQGLTEEHYRANFITLLHTAINFAMNDSTRVFVLSIPDYGVTPFAMGRDSIIGPEIDQFNAINKEESIKAGVNYLDITGISRQAATDPTLIADDGLHPSAKMYQLWVTQLGPMVLARLKKH